MDIKTVQDALKLEQEFNSKLTQQFEALHKGRKLTAPALIEEKEKALERIEKDIEMAAKERDLILSRWDQRIEQRKALLAKLRLEIDELKKQIGR
ncbi:hypothetical protein C8R30_105136 [Nitrosomonas nitrosa]|uniref:Uncharacterized protein n=2 Tax=Nitrosomonas nitrosa TaxID=52442 RepID=A0A1I4M1Z4_9PROT|nr:hypothetical protein C8R30_105136 [Nitrosomonas nitrosa]CAE6484270.1 hypothetical protein NMYAN_10156 [Nitrosomonas nitrosa]SFL97271.1 hypothetical protein SAMN05421880_10379 [Nitrosomonas nitrosa]